MSGMIIIDVDVSAESIQNKTYVCSRCNKPFNSDQSLKKHLLLNHYQLPASKDRAKISYRFVCPVTNCRRSLKMDGEYFTSRKHLAQHFFKVHNTGEFSCSNANCDKKFSTPALRNLHSRNCGKIFTCHCTCCFNSKEALQTHQKRKHPEDENQEKNKKSLDTPPTTRTVSTTTVGLDIWNSPEKLAFPATIASTTSVFTSTDDPISSTDDIPVTKIIKNSSTSTADDFKSEENSNSLSSSSSQTKKNLPWSGDFDDSLNIFDSDMKLEFYTAETQTDFAESLFNNNYTQTTFNDYYDFEKFDIQTQTNWDE